METRTMLGKRSASTASFSIKKTKKSLNVQNHNGDNTNMQVQEVGQIECEGCFENCKEIYTFPCGHSFCKDCVRGLFVAALDDRSLMPVRCCGQRVDQRLRRVGLHLICSNLRWRSLKRPINCIGKLSLFTPQTCLLGNLITTHFILNSFSPRKECATFHNLDKTESSSTGRFLCTGCSTPLCANCLASHPKMTCANFKSIPEGQRSVDDILFYSKAQQARYNKCANCNRFIEHASGCSHMRCPCGHMFNYGAERFRGMQTTPKSVRSFRVTKNVLSASTSTSASVYTQEEEECEHDWVPYNTMIEGSLLCHLCTKSKRCYQTACSKCYRRACPTCQKSLK